MPPKGGFEQLRWERFFPKRGLSAAGLLGAVAVMVFGGHYLVMRGNKVRVQEMADVRLARLDLGRLLDAEEAVKKKMFVDSAKIKGALYEAAHPEEVRALQANPLVASYHAEHLYDVYLSDKILSGVPIQPRRIRTNGFNV